MGDTRQGTAQKKRRRESSAPFYEMVRGSEGLFAALGKAQADELGRVIAQTDDTVVIAVVLLAVVVIASVIPTPATGAATVGRLVVLRGVHLLRSGLFGAALRRFVGFVRLRRGRWFGSTFRRVSLWAAGLRCIRLRCICLWRCRLWGHGLIGVSLSRFRLLTAARTGPLGLIRRGSSFG